MVNLGSPTNSQFDRSVSPSTFRNFNWESLRELDPLQWTACLIGTMMPFRSSLPLTVLKISTPFSLGWGSFWLRIFREWAQQSWLAKWWWIPWHRTCVLKQAHNHNHRAIGAFHSSTLPQHTFYSKHLLSYSSHSSGDCSSTLFFWFCGVVICCNEHVSITKYIVGIT